MSTLTDLYKTAEKRVLNRWRATTRLLQRVTYLALLVWCVAVCLTQLSGPRWEAAAVGLVCALVVLYVQGGVVWRLYRAWFR